MPRLFWNGDTDHIRCIPIPAPLKGEEVWIPPHNGRESVTKDHTCQMQYRGIRENHGKPYEVYICSDPDCQREEWREYTGTQDTIEWRT